MSKRYKVVGYGGLDGLKFPDLYVTYSTGYAIPLHVKQGDYLPLQILNFSDVEKSLLVGSLGRYIKSGDVVIEDEDVITQIKQNPPILPLTETIKLPKNTTAEQTTPSVEISSQQQVVTEVDEKPLTDLSRVKDIESFNRLGFFLKIEFIKKCSDSALLQQISKSTDSIQLQNHIHLRLSTM